MFLKPKRLVRVVAAAVALTGSVVIFSGAIPSLAARTGYDRSIFRANPCGRCAEGTEASRYAVRMAATPTPGPFDPAPVKITPLAFHIVDAAYSTSLDRMIIAAETPNQLHIYNPETGQDKAVDLPLPARFLSVGPDGKVAAVAHDGLIAYIDLQAGQVVKVLDFPYKIASIVLAGNGWVYVGPAAESFTNLYGIEIATRKESKYVEGDIDGDTQFRLHPDGKSLYGATSSSVIAFDVANGKPTRKGGQDKGFPCGRFWISQDGTQFFSRNGDVFRLASGQQPGLKPAGHLAAIAYARSIAHASKAGRILAISEEERPPSCAVQDAEASSSLLIYDYATLKLLKAFIMPFFPEGSTPLGRFVFANAKGTKYYVILQARDTSGLLNDFAVAAGDLTSVK